MKNSLRIKRLVGIASLAAIVVVLQLIANYLPPIAGITINLALFPIVVGAVLYGPLAGSILGAILGVLAITAPSTLTIFIPHNAFATIFVCIAKTSIAGCVSGLLFKYLYKKNFVVAVVLAAIATPILNTFLFTIGAFIWFADLFGGGSYGIVFQAIMTPIWANFFIELAVNSILSPVMIQIIKIAFRNFSIGINLEYKDKFTMDDSKEEANKE